MQIEMERLGLAGPRRSIIATPTKEPIYAYRPEPELEL